MRYRPVSREKREMIRTCRQNGLMHKQIATLVGLHQSTVQRVLKEIAESEEHISCYDQWGPCQP